jgi:hypothetical protein
LSTNISSWTMSVICTWSFGLPRKDAREVLEYGYKQLAHECNMHMELRIASDCDLVNCYKSLQKLNQDCVKLRG